MKKILGLVLGLALVSSSAHAMGMTRSRSMPVTGLDVSSPVLLKDTKGDTVTLTNLNTVELTSNGVTQPVFLTDLHTSFDGFPRANYFIALDGKSSDGKEVAVLFRLADKVSYDSNDYPILPTGFIPPSVTQQAVGIDVALTAPGNWSAPASHVEDQACERQEQQWICSNAGPHEYCTWQTVMVPGRQSVRVTSSDKTDGYTISLKTGDRGTAARISYAQSYTNILDEQPLSPCF